MKKFTSVIALVLSLSMPLISFAKNRDEPLPPLNFAAELAGFISYSDDVSALRSWFEALSTDEQATHMAAFNSRVDELNAKETTLLDAVSAQLEEGASDSNMYLLFETIKGMNPIKARKIFSSLVNRVSEKVNLDYVSSPADPSKAQRARDTQAIRSYIGRA